MSPSYLGIFLLSCDKLPIEYISSKVFSDVIQASQNYRLNHVVKNLYHFSLFRHDLQLINSLDLVNLIDHRVNVLKYLMIRQLIKDKPEI